VLKSRGMAHSNQVREFIFGDQGVDLVDVYLSAERVLTGSARMVHEQQDEASTELRQLDQQRRLRELASRRKALDAQIAALESEERDRAGELSQAIEQE